jgi:hypothetical protein
LNGFLKNNGALRKLYWNFKAPPFLLKETVLLLNRPLSNGWPDDCACFSGRSKTIGDNAG